MIFIVFYYRKALPKMQFAIVKTLEDPLYFYQIVKIASKKNESKKKQSLV